MNEGSHIWRRKDIVEIDRSQIVTFPFTAMNVEKAWKHWAGRSHFIQQVLCLVLYVLFFMLIGKLVR
jgi:hypothetical protein